MKAKSISGGSIPATRLALLASLADGFKPTIAIIFMSVQHDRTALTVMLQAHDIDVLGATSCGEFTDAQHSDGGIAILLIALPRSWYRIVYKAIDNSGIPAIAEQIAAQALSAFAHPSLILCSTGVNSGGEYFDGIALVDNLTRTLGADKLLFGGMAGDDGSFSGSFVFTTSAETDCGCAALVLDSTRVDIMGMAITGWKPMGIKRKVTKSIGNLLYTIDDQSAVAMYLKYLGKEGSQANKNFNLLDELALSFPFIVDRGNGETLVKSPLRIDHHENALVIDTCMPDGTSFWFSSPPDFEIVEEVIAEARQVKNESGAGADALLIFSCAGRPPVLGPMVNMENEGLTEVWQAPMAGFFTYGEYGRAKGGRQHFHSTACCWVALKER